MAAYSVVTWLLNLKDRHNGNILLATDGSVVHIDYGFMFCSSPGGVSFEKAPFKLTVEHAAVMGGVDSPLFNHFRALFIRGLLEARRHAPTLLALVETMGVEGGGPPFPCFGKGAAVGTAGVDVSDLTDPDSGGASSSGRGSADAVAPMRQRLMLDKPEEEVLGAFNALVDQSVGNWSTDEYDQFQNWTQNVAV